MNGEACGVPMCMHVVAKRSVSNGKKTQFQFPEPSKVSGTWVLWYFHVITIQSTVEV